MTERRCQRGRTHRPEDQHQQEQPENIFFDLMIWTTRMTTMILFFTMMFWTTRMTTTDGR
jgi:hypothetical protein